MTKMHLILVNQILIQSIPDSEQFYLSRCDVYSMVDGFDDKGIMNMYMSDRHSDLVFNTGVQYDNGSFEIC